MELNDDFHYIFRMDMGRNIVQNKDNLAIDKFNNEKIIWVSYICIMYFFFLI